MGALREWICIALALLLISVAAYGIFDSVYTPDASRMENALYGLALIVSFFLNGIVFISNFGVWTWRRMLLGYGSACALFILAIVILSMHELHGRTEAICYLLLLFAFPLGNILLSFAQLYHLRSQPPPARRA